MSRFPPLSGIFLLLACLSVRAENCPQAFAPNPPTEAPMLASEAQRLKTLEGVCVNRADYYAYRGLVALQQNQPAVAVEWLERALLLDPQLAGVQVDYARALALSGDKAAAANLARELLNRPDLPATVAAWLPGQYRDWALDEAWVARFSVATLAGYETNLNSAPQNPFITLTLGSGDLQMQLSPQYLARQGAAAQIVASGVVSKETGTDALAVVGQVQARGSNYGDTSYQQADLAVLWHHALEQGGTLLRTDLVSLRYAGQELYQSVRLEPDYEFKPWGVCQPRLGVLYNAYVYPVSPELDGRYVGLVGGGNLRCGGKPVARPAGRGARRGGLQQPPRWGRACYRAVPGVEPAPGARECGCANPVGPYPGRSGL